MDKQHEKYVKKKNNNCWFIWFFVALLVLQVNVLHSQNIHIFDVLGFFAVAATFQNLSVSA